MSQAHETSARRLESATPVYCLPGISSRHSRHISGNRAEHVEVKVPSVLFVVAAGLHQSPTSLLLLASQVHQAICNKLPSGVFPRRRLVPPSQSKQVLYGMFGSSPATPHRPSQEPIRDWMQPEVETARGLLSIPSSNTELQLCPWPDGFIS